MTKIVGAVGIKVKPDTKGFRKEVDREIGSIHTTAHVDFDEAKAKQSINSLKQRLQDQGITLATDADVAAAKRKLDSLDRDLKSTIRADADTSVASAQLDAAARDRTSKLRVDVDKSALDALGSREGGLGRSLLYGALGVGIAGLVSPVTALAGGLIAATPALLGFTGALGAAGLGISGLADEFEGFPDKIKGTQDSLASIFRAGTKGLSDDVAGLVNDQLPALETWAETLSYTLKQSVANLRSPFNTERVSDILTGGAQTWANLAPGLDRYISGILRAGQATTPVLQHMTRNFEKSGAAWEDAITKLANTGQLQTATSGVLSVVGSLGEGIGQIAQQGIMEMAKHAPELRDLADSLGPNIVKLIDGLSGLGGGAVRGITSLVEGLGDLAQWAKPGFDWLGDNVLGNIPVLVDKLHDVDDLVQRVGQWRPLQTLGDGVASILPNADELRQFTPDMVNNMLRFFDGAKALAGVSIEGVGHVLDQLGKMDTIDPQSLLGIANGLGGLSDAISRIADNPATADNVGRIMDGLGKLSQFTWDNSWVAQNLEGDFKALGDLGNWINSPEFAFNADVATMFMSELGARMVEGVPGVMQQLQEAFSAGGFAGVGTTISNTLLTELAESFNPGVVFPVIAGAFNGLDLSGPAFNAAGTFLNTLAAVPWDTATQGITAAFNALPGALSGIAASAAASFIVHLNQLPGQARAVAVQIPAAFVINLAGSGAAMVASFAAGIRSQIGEAVAAANAVVSAVKRLFPHSPAKEGPLSGQGYTDHSGEALVKDFAKGIESQASAARNAANVVTGAVAGAFNTSIEGVAVEKAQAENAKKLQSAIKSHDKALANWEKRKGEAAKKGKKFNEKPPKLNMPDLVEPDTLAVDASFKALYLDRISDKLKQGTQNAVDEGLKKPWVEGVRQALAEGRKIFGNNPIFDAVDYRLGDVNLPDALQNALDKSGVYELPETYFKLLTSELMEVMGIKSNSAVGRAISALQTYDYNSKGDDRLHRDQERNESKAPPLHFHVSSVDEALALAEFKTRQIQFKEPT